MEKRIESRGAGEGSRTRTERCGGGRQGEQGKGSGRSGDRLQPMLYIHHPFIDCFQTPSISLTSRDHRTLDQYII